jgi:hypothetical protein
MDTVEDFISLTTEGRTVVGDSAETATLIRDHTVLPLVYTSRLASVRTRVRDVSGPPHLYASVWIDTCGVRKIEEQVLDATGPPRPDASEQVKVACGEPPGYWYGIVQELHRDEKSGEFDEFTVQVPGFPRFWGACVEFGFFV